jgi:hypothetical protein
MFWPFLTIMLLVKLMWDVTENRIIVRKVLKFFSNITAKYSDHLDFYQYFDSDVEESDTEAEAETETDVEAEEAESNRTCTLRPRRNIVQTTKELQSKIKETLN